MTYAITAGTSGGEDKFVTATKLVVDHGVTVGVEGDALVVSGTAENLAAPETLLVTVTASDNDMASSGTVIFTVTINADDDAPVLKEVEDSAKVVTIAEGATADTTFVFSDFFEDPEGEALTQFSLQASNVEDIPHGLMIGPTSGLVVEGTAANLKDTTTITFSYIASDDAGDSPTVVFTVIIDADDDAPTLASPLPAASLAVMEDMDVPDDTEFDLTSFFTDPEGDTLSFAITAASGGALTDSNTKLVAHGVTVTLDGTDLAVSGTAASTLSASETLLFTVTASDTGSANSPALVFTVAIDADNDAPTATSEEAALMFTPAESDTNQSFTVTLSDYFTDADSDDSTLQFGLGASNLAGTGFAASLDANGNLVLSAATVAQQGGNFVATITVSATDGATGQVPGTRVLSFTITGTDDAPTVVMGAKPIQVRALVDEGFAPFKINPATHFADDGGANNLTLTIEGFAGLVG